MLQRACLFRAGFNGAEDKSAGIRETGASISGQSVLKRISRSVRHVLDLVRLCLCTLLAPEAPRLASPRRPRQATHYPTFPATHAATHPTLSSSAVSLCKETPLVPRYIGTTLCFLQPCLYTRQLPAFPDTQAAHIVFFSRASMQGNSHVPVTQSTALSSSVNN